MKLYDELLFLACVLSLCDITRSFRWDAALPPGRQLTRCVGSNVTFPWAAILNQDEQLKGHEYRRTLFRNSKNHHVQENDTSFTSDPRVKTGPGQSLTISDVRTTDSGNYTVTVLTMEYTVLVLNANTVSLQVVEGPTTADGSLHASLNTTPVKTQNGNTSSWHVKLSCGTFTSRGHPAVTVVWTTPSGQTLPSTSSTNGVFYLSLPRPESGVYNCYIDPQAASLSCLGPNSDLRLNSSVYVDSRVVRDLLLEARMADILAQNTKLLLQVAELEAGQKSCKPESPNFRYVCPEPEPVPLTYRELSGDEVGSNVTYRCRAGYKHTGGDLVRFCHGTGQYSGKPPVCTHADSPPSINCKQLLDAGHDHDGVETLTLHTHKIPTYKLPVYCDQSTDGGGWTVIQRRINGSVDFDRTYKEYEDGFGDIRGEFWLGLKHIDAILRRAYALSYRHALLRFDMVDSKGAKIYQKYWAFALKDPDYTLIAGYRGGNAGDALCMGKGCPYPAAARAFKQFEQRFATKDYAPNYWYCSRGEKGYARRASGGWWFSRSCGLANLNGLYNGTFQTGMIWHSLHSYRFIKWSEMKIKPP